MVLCVNIYIESLKASVKIFPQTVWYPWDSRESLRKWMQICNYTSPASRSELFCRHVSSEHRHGMLVWWLSGPFSFPAKQFFKYLYAIVPMCVSVLFQFPWLNDSPTGGSFAHTCKKMSQYLLKQELNLTVESRKMKEIVSVEEEWLPLWVFQLTLIWTSWILTMLS